MKVLKNNPGDAEVIKIDVSDLKQLTIVCDGKVVAHMYLPEYKITDDVEQKAKTMADSITTYNKCGKLPSELLEEVEAKGTALTELDWKAAELELQNNELLESLKYFTDKVEGGEARSTDTYAKYKALLTKIENNQTPQP